MGLTELYFYRSFISLSDGSNPFHIEARTDFRLEKFESITVWHVPAAAKARAAIDMAWRRLAGQDGGALIELPHLGRWIHVPKAGGGAACFTFSDLCEALLGTSDFVHIPRTFHTLVVENIPVIAPSSATKPKDLFC